MSKLKFKQIEDIILDRQMISFLEFDSYSLFPRPGRIKVIYFDKSTEKSYRWDDEIDDYVLFFTDGTDGVQGYQGFQGYQGTNGADGVQGIQGKQGSRGIQGVQGIPGLTGADGKDGVQGFQGLQGADGASGTDGVQGFQGYQGYKGADGTQGVQGYQGFQGKTGVQGFQGIQGTNGKDGVQGFQGYKGADGANGVQGFQGYQGTNGKDGVQGYQGIPGLTGDTGANGVQGFQGYQGTNGKDGVQGYQGYKGADGTQGVQGYQGFQGKTGVQGFQGYQGTNGKDGVQGFQGYKGADGANGKDGVQGFQGYQGTNGKDGVQGFQGIPGLTGDDGKDGVQGFQGYKGTNGVQGFQGPKGDGADVNVVGKAISGTYERKYIDVVKSPNGGIQEYTVSHALRTAKTISATTQNVTVTAAGTTINIPTYTFDNAGHHKENGTLSLNLSLDTIDEKESVSTNTVGGTLMSSIESTRAVYPGNVKPDSTGKVYGWVEQYIDKDKSMKLTLDNLLSIYDEELSKLRTNLITEFTSVFGEFNKSGVLVTEDMQAAYDNSDTLFTSGGLGFMGGFWSFYYDVYWSTVMNGGSSNLVSALSNFESAINNILDSIIQKFDIVEVREWGMSDKNYIYEALPLNTKLDIDPTTLDNYIHYDNFTLRRYKSQMIGIGDNGYPGDAETAHYDVIAFMHELVDNTKLSGICYDRHKPLCIDAIIDVLLGYNTRMHGCGGDVSVVRFWRIEEVDAINDFGPEITTAEQVANQIAESTSGILTILQQHEKYINANTPSMVWISNQSGETTEYDKSTDTYIWNIEFDRIEGLGIEPYSISITAMKEYNGKVWKQVIPDVEFDDNNRKVKVHLSSQLDGKNNVGYIKLQICGTLN